MFVVELVGKWERCKLLQLIRKLCQADESRTQCCNTNLTNTTTYVLLISSVFRSPHNNFTKAYLYLYLYTGKSHAWNSAGVVIILSELLNL